jgi:hypothetical protein
MLRSFSGLPVFPVVHFENETAADLSIINPALVPKSGNEAWAWKK